MDTPAKLKVTPKDFFFWLGAMVGLYVSAVSLILLVHSYIEVYFPNQLVSYGDPYSGAIRFSIASLIVMYPLYVWLTYMLHKDIRETPEKKELWVRKWLVVLTLFIAGLTIAIDLIAVVYVFLNGDITARFVLKALAILVVLGGGFWYYVHELRGTWERKAGLSKIIGIIVSALVIISIGSAFLIIGSPTSERLYRLDEQRVSDLQNVQWQVVSYWQQKEKLPTTISEMEDPLTGFVAPRDPETGLTYTYSVVSPLAFKLCADFKAPSRNTAGKASVPVPVRGDPSNENWVHTVGTACFDRTIDPERFPPLKK